MANRYFSSNGWHVYVLADDTLCICEQQNGDKQEQVYTLLPFKHLGTVLLLFFNKYFYSAFNQKLLANIFLFGKYFLVVAKKIFCYITQRNVQILFEASVFVCLHAHLCEWMLACVVYESLRVNPRWPPPLVRNGQWPSWASIDALQVCREVIDTHQWLQVLQNSRGIREQDKKKGNSSHWIPPWKNSKHRVFTPFIMLKQTLQKDTYENYT